MLVAVYQFIDKELKMSTGVRARLFHSEEEFEKWKVYQEDNPYTTVRTISLQEVEIPEEYSDLMDDPHIGLNGKYE